METIKNRAASVGLALAVSIGVSACGNGSSKEKPSPQKPRQQLHSSPNIPKVKVRYFSDGSRELVLDGLYDTTITGTDENNGGADTALSNIYEWCDGKDFMEESLGNSGYDGGQSSSVQRIVNYPACTDGRLTPSDFAPSPSEK